jgi:hypothetical protein
MAYGSLTIYAQNLEKGQEILEKLKDCIDEDVVVAGGYSNMSVVIVP